MGALSCDVRCGEGGVRVPTQVYGWCDGHVGVEVRRYALVNWLFVVMICVMQVRTCAYVGVMGVVLAELWWGCVCVSVSASMSGGDWV